MLDAIGSNNFGKWPRAMGNAIFLDSSYLVENLIEMAYKNTVNLATRNNYNMNTLLQVDNFYIFVKGYLQNKTINDYAMMAYVQMNNRVERYMKDKGLGV